MMLTGCTAKLECRTGKKKIKREGDANYGGGPHASANEFRNGAPTRRREVRQEEKKYILWDVAYQALNAVLKKRSVEEPVQPREMAEIGKKRDKKIAK
ncbi:hypothetical protein MRX96_021249 [Rhipicephalus microplus]